LELAGFHVQCSAHRQEGVLGLESEVKARGQTVGRPGPWAHVDISALAMAHAGEARESKKKSLTFSLGRQCHQQQTTSGMRNSASAVLPRNGHQTLFALKFS
jgi:hypothetical protein